MKIFTIHSEEDNALLAAVYTEEEALEFMREEIYERCYDFRISELLTLNSKQLAELSRLYYLSVEVECAVAIDWRGRLEAETAKLEIEAKEKKDAEKQARLLTVNDFLIAADRRMVALNKLTPEDRAALGF